MKNLSTVKTFNSRTEAEIAKSFLESNGIKSRIFADDVGIMYPSQQTTMGVKLVVNKKDFNKAKKLLGKK